MITHLTVDYIIKSRTEFFVISPEIEDRDVNWTKHEKTFSSHKLSGSAAGGYPSGLLL
jgi:hypothetical protein